MSIDNQKPDLEKISAASKLEDKKGIEKYIKQEIETSKGVIEYIKQLSSLLAIEGSLKFLLFCAVLYFLGLYHNKLNDLFLFILGVPLNVILDIPLEDSFLKNVPTDETYKKYIFMMFSTITLSFTVIITTLIIGVFKSNKNHIQNLLKNIVPKDD